MSCLKDAQGSWNDIRNGRITILKPHFCCAGYSSQGVRYFELHSFIFMTYLLRSQEAKGVAPSLSAPPPGSATDPGTYDMTTIRGIAIRSCTTSQNLPAINFYARFGSHLVAFNVRCSPHLVCVPAALQMRISIGLHLCKQYSWKRTLDHLQGGRSVHYERKVTVSPHFSCGDHLKHCSSFLTTSRSAIYSFMWWYDCSLMAKSGTPCQLRFCSSFFY